MSYTFVKNPGLEKSSPEASSGNVDKDNAVDTKPAQKKPILKDEFGAGPIKMPVKRGW